jgi:hypothetical protein
MIIGVDFDNTIVCYDRLFYRLASESGLVPADIPQSKTAIRDYLRSINKEEIWTQMQGVAYGPQITDAKPFNFVKDFFSRATKSKHTVYIISHKTLYPFEGPKYNLHQAATNWLIHNGFFTDIDDFSEKNVFFEVTKQDKLNRIKLLNCEVFIDDLPELLNDPDFCSTTSKVLFDPNNSHSDIQNITTSTSWDNLINLLLK